MSTTTIRLPEELKARVAAAARSEGMTAHGFILEAIAEKAAQVEQQAEFDAQAEERYAKLVRTGESIAWADMRRYLEARMQGDTAPAPVARKLAR